MIWAGSPGVRWRSAKTVMATTPMTGMVARTRRAISSSTTGRELHLDVPENGGAELQHALDVLAKRARRDELPPRHVRHFVVGEELDLLGELLLLGGVRLAHPLRAELLHALAGRPAEPRALARAVDEGVDRGVDDVERRRPRVEDVPPALGRRILLGPAGHHRGPVHGVDVDVR